MTMLLRRLWLFATVMAVLGSARLSYAEPSPLVWHDEYGSAVRDAMAQKQMLFIFFNDQSATAERFEKEVLAHRDIRPLLENYTLARLPMDATVAIEGKPAKLLSHGAFSHMYGSPGFAIVDYTDNGSSEYGQVVSQYNFRGPQGRTVDQMQAILTLPPGSLTQRTLIYAVRTHPEKPRSTTGIFRRLLAFESFRHSRHQASIQLQGHHQWDSRFQQIKSQLPGNLVPTEVCAESWPGQRLEDAAIECVRSWRFSSGHWSAVSDHNVYYGYDMKLGRNGIWYATGIFARHR